MRFLTCRPSGMRYARRRDLERYAIPYFGRKQLVGVRVEHIDQRIAWLINDQEQARRHEQENAQRRAEGRRPLPAPGPLRDRTVQRIVAVVSAMFRTAVRHSSASCARRRSRAARSRRCARRPGRRRAQRVRVRRA